MPRPGGQRRTSLLIHVADLDSPAGSGPDKFDFEPLGLALHSAGEVVLIGNPGSLCHLGEVPHQRGSRMVGCASTLAPDLRPRRRSGPNACQQFVGVLNEGRAIPWVIMPQPPGTFFL